MFNLFRRFASGKRFSSTVLRKNDISLLILDVRWNNLFKNIPKSAEIQRCEERLKELLKNQARLTAESKEIPRKKKEYMDRILKLTTEAFENNNEEAKKEMRACEREIKLINIRAAEIEAELDEMPDLLNKANLELLENAVNVVYFKIRADQKRVEVLEKLIEETRNKLKQYIDEKETLSQDYTDIYSYFHDLLGGDELEKLDREYFGKRK